MSYPSIKLIAERCGVTHATVSRALRDSPLVKAQTRQQILQCARDLRYRPNRLARSLKTRTTKTIGFVIPNVLAPTNALTAEHLYREAFRHGYNIFFLLSEDDVHEEMEAINEFLATRVDGLIVQSTLHSLDAAPPDHPLRDIRRDKFPCVLIRSATDLGIPFVNTDGAQAIHLTTTHLLDQGYREVRLLQATTRGTPMHREKIEGFQQALRDRGLPAHPDWIITREVEWESMATIRDGDGQIKHQRYFDYQRVVPLGSELAAEALASTTVRPLGLVGANDELASGAWGHLVATGRQAPGEVGVAGCDDTIAPRLPLTSVRWDYEDLAREAVGCVLKQIEKKPFARGHKVAGKLCVRESSRRIEG